MPETKLMKHHLAHKILCKMRGEGKQNEISEKKDELIIA